MWEWIFLPSAGVVDVNVNATFWSCLDRGLIFLIDERIRWDITSSFLVGLRLALLTDFSARSDHKASDPVVSDRPSWRGMWFQAES
jgi:hypothetical protein